MTQSNYHAYGNRLKDIREQINAQPLTNFIQMQTDKQGKYCCPVCGSGSGEHGTSALKIYAGTNRVKCYSGGCFGDKGEDTLGALELIWNCTEQEAISRAGYSLERAEENKPTVKKAKSVDKQPPKNYAEDYKQWHTFLLQAQEALNYLHSRGITNESIEKHNLGYDAAWKHPNAKYNYTSRRIIVPRNEYSYLARCIDSENSAPKLIVGEQKIIFNSVQLDNDLASERDAPVIIVEGELDAISIEQAGHERVIGVGSITNCTSVLLDAIETINPRGAYILALDNDASGKESQEKLAAAMEERGITFVAADAEQLYAGCKDANAAYLEDAEGLYNRLAEYVNAAYEKASDALDELDAEAYSESGIGAVDSFLQAIQTPIYKPMPTGMQSVDKALGGGITRQSLTMIAGSPGIGKTIFSAQLCEHMAQGDLEDDRIPIDVLYINLEMSKEQLMARSFARLSTQCAGDSLDYLTIMRGYEWTPEQRERVLELADEYKREIASHLVYNPKLLGMSADNENPASLETIMKKIAQERRRLGHSPDVIVIDYLQLVQTSSSNGNADMPAETIKKATTELKKYAIENNCAVICITASNRASIVTGAADLTSGRDTSAIEYSADLHLGLSYEAIESKSEYTAKGKNAEKTITLADIKSIKAEYYKHPENRKAVEEYNKYAANIRLTVNKNRIGIEGAYATLCFDGKHMILREVDRMHTEQRFTELDNNEDLPFQTNKPTGKIKML